MFEHSSQLYSTPDFNDLKRATMFSPVNETFGIVPIEIPKTMAKHNSKLGSYDEAKYNEETKKTKNASDKACRVRLQFLAQRMNVLLPPTPVSTPSEMKLYNERFC